MIAILRNIFTAEISRSLVGAVRCIENSGEVLGSIFDPGSSDHHLDFVSSYGRSVSSLVIGQASVIIAIVLAVIQLN